MDLINDALNLAKENKDAVAAGIDQAADFVAEKTGGQFQDQIDQAAEFVKDRVAGQE